LTYDLIQGSDIETLRPNGTITLPAATVGSAGSEVQVRVRNTGDAETKLGILAVSGSAFQLANVPVLPATLAPGDGVTFTVSFTPQEPGAATGNLRIDNVLFLLAGMGLGAKLGLSADVGLGPAAVAPGAAITLPSTAVADRRSAMIQVSNTGSAATRINAISVSGEGYSIAGLPALPANLDPGQSLGFEIRFSPQTVGPANGILQVNDQTIKVQSAGDNPPALPAVRFTNLPGQIQALDQPSVGVEMASSYGSDVTGTLTLSFASETFVDDPSIQFSTGGRTIPFRIPAGSTRAEFGPGRNQMVFQAGTVAGTIKLSAAFSVGAQVDVTPAPAPASTLTLAAAAPQIRSLQTGARTANSLELLITGYSTSRSVTELRFGLTGAPGVTLKTPSLTASVDGAFRAWYDSAASRPFGSQFTVTVRFDLSGDGNGVQSISVTAVNERGTSSPKSIDVR
jgi:hypothetical protein